MTIWHVFSFVAGYFVGMYVMGVLATDDFFWFM